MAIVIIISIAAILLILSSLIGVNITHKKESYNENALITVCTHEAAHAIIGYHFKDLCGSPIRVCVEPDDSCVTYEDGPTRPTSDEMFDAIIIRTLSGVVAERVILNEKTTSGLHDMQTIKSNYITKYKDNAFSDDIVIEEFLSEKTKERIHKAIELEFKEHTKQAEELVEKYQSEIKQLANMLTKKENSCLEGDELEALLDNLIN